MDAEKITINLVPVELGKIDLLVSEGLYSNRTDFIRAGIRSQLDKHRAEVQQTVVRHAMVVGLSVYDRKGLERLRRDGKRVQIRVLGLLSLAGDVPPELAKDTIESVHVRGVFKASDEVKAALGDRMV